MYVWIPVAFTQSQDSLHRTCFTQSREAAFPTQGRQQLYRTQFDLWLFSCMLFILTGSFLVNWKAWHSTSDWPLTLFGWLLLQFLVSAWWCIETLEKMKLRWLGCGGGKENKELLSFEQHKDLYRQWNFIVTPAFSCYAFYSSME